MSWRFFARTSYVLLLGICCTDCMVSAEETSPPPIQATAADLNLSRYSIYTRDPKAPVPFHIRTEAETELERLEQIDMTSDEEFTAPPLIVSRISSLAPGTGGGGITQALVRAERNLLRERAKTADRLFNRGEHAAAIELMMSTERILKTVDVRVIALNRLAAYHFRLHQYDETALYARRAWELNPLDYASACNVAATLLTVGRVDEALDILLRMYGQVFDRRHLAFSAHFNLACAYSLKGESVKALQNLAVAAQLDPVATFTVLGDPQLDAIRDAPDFQRIHEALTLMVQRAKVSSP